MALKNFEEQLANGSTDVLQHDIEFHLQIARASGNRYFYDALGQMGRAVSPRTRLGKAEIAELDQIERLRNVLSEHKAIYLSGNPATRSRRRARRHAHVFEQ